MIISDSFWQNVDKFIHYIYDRTGFMTIICDENGVIKKAIDTKRIGNTHNGSVKIIKGEVDEYAVTAEEAANNKFVKEGYSCPIVIDGKIIGTIGITGKLEITKPIAIIATVAIVSWFNEIYQKELFKEISEKIFADIESIYRRINDSSEKFKIVGNEMNLTSKKANEKTNTASQIIATVQDIAQQMNVLSINGLIVSARAGEAGRAFKVVAQEIKKLAQSTNEETLKIQQNVSDILYAIEALNSFIGKSSALFQDNAKMVQEITPMIQELRTMITKLATTFKIE